MVSYKNGVILWIFKI